MTSAQYREPAPDRKKANFRVAIIACAVLAGMVGLTAASVPLYRIFCQVTGLAGTPQRADGLPLAEKISHVAGKEIDIRFDGNVRGLEWQFKPVENVMRVKFGEQNIAYFRATNMSSKPVTGSATFNVSPNRIGQYFVKMQCFCFNEQTLQPGETVDMPVIFYVEPDLLEERFGRTVSEITLSYTFFPVDHPTGATGLKTTGREQIAASA